MTSTLLSTWQAKDCDPGAGDPGTIAADLSGWTNLSLPDDLYLALHAAGKLPDPFYDQNEAACAWVGEREWWWRATFSAPSAAEGERLILGCQGLDTFATLWESKGGRLLITSLNLMTLEVYYRHLPLFDREPPK